MTIERRKKISVEFNIAPLIDVVFQLLVFFALTSYFAANPGIEVSLPNAESAVNVQKQHTIVFITREGAIYCNTKKTELSELHVILKHASNTVKTVILKSDESVPLGVVVRVIDAIKQSGIKDLVIATEKKNAL
jgi:biopolymer transport protein ExbD